MLNWDGLDGIIVVESVAEIPRFTIELVCRSTNSTDLLTNKPCQALQEVLQLNKKYKLCWVPKSVTRKCADPDCKKVFRDGYSQHHCRCCGRVFCYDCSNTR